MMSSKKAIGTIGRSVSPSVRSAELGARKAETSAPFFAGIPRITQSKPGPKAEQGITDITRRPRVYRPVAAFELTGSVLVSPKETLSTSSLLACLILFTLADARVVSGNCGSCWWQQRTWLIDLVGHWIVRKSPLLASLAYV